MEEVSITEVITSLIEYNMRDKYTAIPAVVLTVHNEGTNLFVNVQPLVSIREKDGTVTQQATILNVPLQQPASSIGGMVFPIKTGDNVLLVFSMRGIDTWKHGDGTPTAASDFRMFSKMDCVAIPCIFPGSKTPVPSNKHTAGYKVGDVALYHGMGGNMTEIILKESGGVIVNSPGKVTVNCVDSEVNASNSATYNTKSFSIKCESYSVSASSYSMNSSDGGGMNGTFRMNGSFILNGINIETHKHTGVQTGSGTSGGPV